MILRVLIARYVLARRPSVNAQAAPAIAAARAQYAGFGAVCTAGVETPGLAGRVIADGPGKRYLEENGNDLQALSPARAQSHCGQRLPRLDQGHAPPSRPRHTPPFRP